MGRWLGWRVQAFGDAEIGGSYPPVVCLLIAKKVLTGVDRLKALAVGGELAERRSV